MANELSVLDQSYEAFMADGEAARALTGQGSSGNRSNLPRLSVNYEAELEVDGEDEPIALPRGHFCLDIATSIEGGKTQYKKVYAKNIIFRPFVQVYEYSIYDPKKKKVTLATTQFRDWGEAILDTEGREMRAAKYKRYFKDTMRERADTLKCHRVVYGTVTMIKPKAVDETEHTVEDLPCVLRLRGSNFVPLGDVFEKLGKQNKNMFNYPLNATTRREKSDGLTYFIIDYEPSDTEVMFTEENFELLKKYVETISAYNETILTAYNKAAAEKNMNSDAKSLAEDFSDALPDNMS